MYPKSAIAALAAICFLLSAAVPAVAGDGSQWRVGGRSFADRQTFYRSDFFRQQGLRCGTRQPLAPRAIPEPGDCTTSITNPSDDYAATTLLGIPVVVHIIESSSGEGVISDAMVASQIEILNEDFLALAGTPGAPGAYGAIQFSLATVDPDGNPTTAITRSVNDTWFQDQGQYWETLAWDTSRYMNIYTNSADGYLGYVPAFPQDGITGQTADRVVVAWASFGRDSSSGPPYDQGRTATHEVGHYLGLYHSFQDGCSAESQPSCYTEGDTLCDTPSESEPNYGCPADGSTEASSCGSTDPIHNYMDYSDDTCMYEFTAEQVRRMRCSLLNYRSDLGVIINPPVCGNDLVELGEQCDGISDSACPGQCQSDCNCPPPVCGDGVVEGSEECDGASASACPTGVCLNDCTCEEPVCGNGVLEEGEQCDGASDQACPGQCGDVGTSDQCQCLGCGNGVCDSGEDDANCAADCGCAAAGVCDGPAPYDCWCDALCYDYGDCCVDVCESCQICESTPVCGDGTVEGSEECDGSADAFCFFGVCLSDCTCEVPVCGNGTIESTEECDGTPASVCSTGVCLSDCTCEVPVCGNGTIEGSEECDGTSASACSTGVCLSDCTCEVPVCGNGTLESSEECDDGNTANGDGCSSVCTVEVPLGSEDIKCLTAMNKSAAKLAKTIFKEQARCIKSAARGKPSVPSAAGCIENDTRGKVARAESKLIYTQQKRCSAYFLDGDDWAAEIVVAAHETGGSLLVSVFGLDLDAAVADRTEERDLANCQSQVVKGVGKLLVAQMGAFNKCKSKGFKSGLLETQGALDSCMAVVTSDPRVIKAADKLEGAAVSRCPTSMLANGFPGTCSEAPAATTFASCADGLVTCHACSFLSEIDELSSDCDLIDDGENNASCPARPAELNFQQSMLQAFYFVIDASVDGEQLTDLDWIGAFSGDVCVGARAWAGPWTDVPAMGDSGDSFTEGYLSSGEQPSFKIYDASSGKILDATPSSNCPFANLLFCYLDDITGTSGD